MILKNNWSASGFNKYVSPDLVDDEFLDAEIVILLQGKNSFGKAIYSYLKVTGRNLKEMFGKMRAGDNFNPNDYGTVIAAGLDSPTKEVRDEMAQLHNMIEVPLPKPAAPKPAFVQPKFFDD